jgi:UDP-N-acetylmuramoyl-tripeptide--D-alanyl-D-alanine ligase
MRWTAGQGQFTGVAFHRFHTGVAWITVLACVLACVPAGLRFLRVAQREHYLGGSALLFAARWWRTTPANVALALVALATAVASLVWPLAGVATAAAVAVGPIGLTLKGRTSPLAWTRRLRTLAIVWAVIEAVIVAAGVATGLAAPLAVVAALALPVVVDVACWLTSPLERRLSSHFVDEAEARLRLVDPLVVGITGSYGKTSTKGHLSHLLRPGRAVVATPASFNNRPGLARAINEHLADGTEVFIAEMGTYGPGEIADLCRWCPPDIAVITAIGPVHLERFGTEDRIVEAKSEILQSAADVVLQIDDRRLAAVADRAEAEGKRVVRCSATDPSADVCVTRSDDGAAMSAHIHGELLVERVPVAAGIQATNLACAIGVALVAKVAPSDIALRLVDLPQVDHRLQAARAASGVVVLDDTYNSNPAGAAGALVALASAAAAGGAWDGTGADSPDVETRGPEARAEDRSARLVVVTPGMVELGTRQFSENRRFGEAIATVATDLLVVGRTNRRALLAGVESAPGARTSVLQVSGRQEAVDWVRSHLRAGDTVLYENDLPDHYP